MNFRALVDKACRAGIPPTHAPRTMFWAAERCGISRPYLYMLMSGQRVGPDHTVARIAKGLGYTEEQVRRALDRTLRQTG